MPRDYRGTASHCLNHYQPKRFRPIDREEQRVCIAQKFFFLASPDFPDEFDQWLIEHGLDQFVEIFAICLVNFGRYLELPSRAFGDLDGAVNTLLRRDAAEESQLILRRFVKIEEILRQTVVNFLQPWGGRNRPARRVGDRYERHLSELLIE